MPGSPVSRTSRTRSIFRAALGGFRPTDGFHETGQSDRRVRDGFSKTVLASEVRTRATERDQRGVWALPWSGSSLISADVHPAPDGHYLPLEQWRTKSYTPWMDRTEQEDRSQTPNQQSFFDVILVCPPPDAVESLLERMPCTNFTGDNRFWSAAPRSLHPGGVFVVFLDGHVIFLRDEVDYPVFASMVHTDDRQTYDLPE